VTSDEGPLTLTGDEGCAGLRRFFRPGDQIDGDSMDAFQSKSPLGYFLCKASSLPKSLALLEPLALRGLLFDDYLPDHPALSTGIRKVD
jgi:hypothetical protein